MKLLLSALAICALGLLGGCATATPDRDLSRSVADGAAQYNEAYGAAVNAMILQNILRASDRLPRHYTLMSQVQISPGQERQTNGTLAELPFGNGDASEPWGKGTIGGTLTNKSQASYAITPPAEEKLTKGIYNPIDPDIFESYLNRHFADEVLFETFINVVSEAPPLTPTVKANKVNDVANTRVEQTRNCKDLAAKAELTERTTVLRDCVVKQLILARTKNDASVSISDTKKLKLEDPCKIIATVREGGAVTDLRLMTSLEKAKALGYTLEPTKSGIKIKSCKSEPGVTYLTISERASEIDPGDQIHFKVVLRSFDSMIFALGKRVHESSDADLNACNTVKEGKRCAPRNIFVAGAQHGKVRPAGERFAAVVTYDDKTYVAGPPTKSSEGDLSGTTLTLLTQLLALAQSPESVQTSPHLVVY